MSSSSSSGPSTPSENNNQLKRELEGDGVDKNLKRQAERAKLEKEQEKQKELEQEGSQEPEQDLEEPPISEPQISKPIDAVIGAQGAAGEELEDGEIREDEPPRLEQQEQVMGGPPQEWIRNLEQLKLMMSQQQRSEQYQQMEQEMGVFYAQQLEQLGRLEELRDPEEPEESEMENLEQVEQNRPLPMPEVNLMEEEMEEELEQEPEPQADGRESRESGIVEDEDPTFHPSWRHHRIKLGPDNILWPDDLQRIRNKVNALSNQHSANQNGVPFAPPAPAPLQMPAIFPPGVPIPPSPVYTHPTWVYPNPIPSYAPILGPQFAPIPGSFTPLPPGAPFVNPTSISPSPWFPLGACLSRAPSDPVVGPDASGSSVPGPSTSASRPSSSSEDDYTMFAPGASTSAQAQEEPMDLSRQGKDAEEEIHNTGRSETAAETVVQIVEISQTGQNNSTNTMEDNEQRSVEDCGAADEEQEKEIDTVGIDEEDHNDGLEESPLATRPQKPMQGPDGRHDNEKSSEDKNGDLGDVTDSSSSKMVQDLSRVSEDNDEDDSDGQGAGLDAKRIHDKGSDKNSDSNSDNQVMEMTIDDEEEEKDVDQNGDEIEWLTGSEPERLAYSDESEVSEVSEVDDDDSQSQVSENQGAAKYFAKCVKVVKEVAQALPLPLMVPVDKNKPSCSNDPQRTPDLIELTSKTLSPAPEVVNDDDDDQEVLIHKEVPQTVPPLVEIIPSQEDSSIPQLEPSVNANPEIANIEPVGSTSIPQGTSSSVPDSSRRRPAFSLIDSMMEDDEEEVDEEKISRFYKTISLYESPEKGAGPSSDGDTIEDVERGQDPPPSCRMNPDLDMDYGDDAVVGAKIDLLDSMDQLTNAENQEGEPAEESVSEDPRMSSESNTKTSEKAIAIPYKPGTMQHFKEVANLYKAQEGTSKDDIAAPNETLQNPTTISMAAPIENESPVRTRRSRVPRAHRFNFLGDVGHQEDNNANLHTRKRVAQVRFSPSPDPPCPKKRKRSRSQSQKGRRKPKINPIKQELAPVPSFQPNNDDADDRKNAIFDYCTETDIPAEYDVDERSIDQKFFAYDSNFDSPI